jgi:hypothetical protein
MMNLIWLHGGYMYMNCDDMKHMTSILDLEWPDIQRRFVDPSELDGLPDLPVCIRITSTNRCAMLLSSPIR